MVNFEPFAVEDWMDTYETKARFNVAETSCASISLQKLAELSDEKGDSIIPSARVLNYGDIRGMKALRSNIAQLYSVKSSNLPVTSDGILVTPGAISANFLLFYSLVSPGDHVICHYPTYQQLYSVPASLGAEVDLWKVRPENDWLPDIEELSNVIRPNTKLIIINNPQNPTGAVLRRPLLQQIIDLARKHDITVMSDEVYRPLFHSISPDDPELPPSIVSMDYGKVVATGSLSKAFSLAGIRVGWIASPDHAIIDACAQARHYTTISVSQIDEAVAATALSPTTVKILLARNFGIAKANLELLDRFIGKNNQYLRWTKPSAGSTAFVQFSREGKAVDAVQLCKTLLGKTEILLVPGDLCFGTEFKGFLRFGYLCETDVLQEALERLDIFMRKQYEMVPLAT